MVTLRRAFVAAARSALRSMLPPDEDEPGPASAEVLESPPYVSSTPKMLVCLPSTGFQLAALGPMTLNAFIVPCICSSVQASVH
jgi:hypothetical protein